MKGVSNIIIKDKNYYNNFNNDILNQLHSVDYHYNLATRWGRIYYATKNKRGYGWLNKIAYRRNKKHCVDGLNIANEAYRRCFLELNCLIDFLTKNGDL